MFNPEITSKDDQKKMDDIASWQDVPISVSDITPDVCAVCPSGKTQCPGHLQTMGLGKYCFSSYLKYREDLK